MIMPPSRHSPYMITDFIIYYDYTESPQTLQSFVYLNHGVSSLLTQSSVANYFSLTARQQRDPQNFKRLPKIT